MAQISPNPTWPWAPCLLRQLKVRNSSPVGCGSLGTGRSWRDSLSKQASSRIVPFFDGANYAVRAEGLCEFTSGFLVGLAWDRRMLTHQESWGQQAWPLCLLLGGEGTSKAGQVFNYNWPWTTRAWTAWVHLYSTYMWTVFNKYIQSCKCIFSSLRSSYNVFFF